MYLLRLFFTISLETSGYCINTFDELPLEKISQEWLIVTSKWKTYIANRKWKVQVQEIALQYLFMDNRCSQDVLNGDLCSLEIFFLLLHVHVTFNCFCCIFQEFRVLSDSEINLCAISIIYCVAFTTFCTTVLVVMGIDSRFRAALDMQNFFVAMTTEKTQFSRLIFKCFFNTIVPFESFDIFLQLIPIQIFLFIM